MWTIFKLTSNLCSGLILPFTWSNMYTTWVCRKISHHVFMPISLNAGLWKMERGLNLFIYYKSDCFFCPPKWNSFKRGFVFQPRHLPIPKMNVMARHADDLIGIGSTNTAMRLLPKKKLQWGSLLARLRGQTIPGPNYIIMVL